MNGRTGKRFNGRAREGGSAALEVLLLLPFILLIFMLLFVMGYNAERKRVAQAALRLGSFAYVDGLATMDRPQSEQAAEDLVNGRLFPGETGAANLTFVTDNSKPAEAGAVDAEYQGESQQSNSLLGAMSSRITVDIAVKRSAPYPDLVPDTDIAARYIVSSNTWTYCEMKDDDFGGGLDALNGVDIVGGYALWLFGGCGGDGTFSLCEDNCQ